MHSEQRGLQKEFLLALRETKDLFWFQWRECFEEMPSHEIPNVIAERAPLSFGIHAHGVVGCLFFYYYYFMLFQKLEVVELVQGGKLCLSLGRQWVQGESCPMHRSQSCRTSH